MDFDGRPSRYDTIRYVTPLGKSSGSPGKVVVVFLARTPSRRTDSNLITRRRKRDERRKLGGGGKFNQLSLAGVEISSPDANRVDPSSGSTGNETRQLPTAAQSNNRATLSKRWGERREEERVLYSRLPPRLQSNRGTVVVVGQETIRRLMGDNTRENYAQ